MGAWGVEVEVEVEAIAEERRDMAFLSHFVGEYSIVVFSIF